MRVVLEVPHPQLKITVFMWNDKYIVKLEIDRYEQVYKIACSDVSGLDQVKSMLDDDFIESCMQRFIQMRSDFLETFKKYQ
jgi:hypothetical protein